MKKTMEILEKELNDAVVKYINCKNKMAELLVKLNHLNVQSKYITCRECGSKLSVAHMKSHVVGGFRLKCPVCNSKTALYSTTANSRLETAGKKLDAARKNVDACQKALDKAQENAPKRTPQEDGIREVEDRLEIIYSQNKTPDFIEIKGEIGGDMLCYRVYNDGSICEK